MQLKIFLFYPHGSGKQTFHSCENIEKICGPGFPKSAVQKILYPTLAEERSNWISTFYSGVDTNAFISSPIIFSSKFPSLISSTRRLDHFSHPRHASPFFDFQKLSPPSCFIQFVKNNASKGEFQNFFKEATAYAGLAFIPTLYRFFKNTITAWLIFKY